MERLTKKGQLFGNEVNYVVENDCFPYGYIHKKYVGTAIDRLAAYENTGLEPCDYNAVQAALELADMASKQASELVRIVVGIGIDHLRELSQAKKDGRLVVLPCKVGETAWVKDRAGIPHEMKLEAPDIRLVCPDGDNLCTSLCNRTIDGLCSYQIKNDGSDIGKTVFLTREEAEAALQNDKP